MNLTNKYVLIETENKGKVKVKRVSHIMRNNSKVELPQNILFLDSESTVRSINGISQEHVFKLVCCIRYVNIKGEYKEIERVHFWDLPSFHEYLDKIQRAKTKLYVVAHNWHYDFNILQLLPYLQSREYKIKNMSIDSSRFLIKARLGNKTLCFIDNTNFYKTSIKELGKLFMLEKLEYDFNTTDDPKLLVEYCYRDTEILAKSFIALLNFINKNNIGNFAPTIASLAFNAYRHRFMQYKIFIHNNLKAIKLELDSYRGGLCDIFYKGKFKGKFYKLDVNSMYPYVMSKNTFPIKLIGVYEGLPVEYLTKLSDKYLWIARVNMSISKAVIPLHYNKKLCLIEGNITATITSAEYEAFKEFITIHKIHEIAIYEHAPIFAEFVKYFYEMRLRAKEAGDTINANFFKLILNSLYGKFGQAVRERELIKVDKLKPEEIGIEFECDEGSVSHKLVQINDYYLILKERVLGRDSFPAIASFVTAYARVYLMQLILRAGEDNVYYVDTDSLIVNQQGYEALKPLIDEVELGKLKLEGEANEIEIVAPKWYRFGNKVKHKGVKEDAVQINSTKWRQMRWNKTLTLWRKGLLDRVLTQYYYVEHTGDYDKGIVESNGKVKKFVVNAIKKS